MLKVMHRNALAQIRCGQKFPAFVDLQFRYEVVGAYEYNANCLDLSCEVMLRLELPSARHAWKRVNDVTFLQNYVMYCIKTDSILQSAIIWELEYPKKNRKAYSWNFQGTGHNRYQWLQAWVKYCKKICAIIGWHYQFCKRPRKGSAFLIEFFQK